MVRMPFGCHGRGVCGFESGGMALFGGVRLGGRGVMSVLPDGAAVGGFVVGWGGGSGGGMGGGGKMYHNDID